MVISVPAVIYLLDDQERTVAGPAPVVLNYCYPAHRYLKIEVVGKITVPKDVPGTRICHAAVYNSEKGGKAIQIFSGYESWSVQAGSTVTFGEADGD